LPSYGATSQSNAFGYFPAGLRDAVCLFHDYFFRLDCRLDLWIDRIVCRRRSVLSSAGFILIVLYDLSDLWFSSRSLSDALGLLVRPFDPLSLGYVEPGLSKCYNKGG